LSTPPAPGRRAWPATPAATSPIEPGRSDVFVLDHRLVASRVTPTVLDYSLGLSFHTEGRGLLISAGRGLPLPEEAIWSGARVYEVLHRR
jgi:hypothetical protein